MATRNEILEVLVEALEENGFSMQEAIGIARDQIYLLQEIVDIDEDEDESPSDEE